MQYDLISMTTGRDYRAYGYEYVIMGRVGRESDDWKVIDRKGGFPTNSGAKQAGLKSYRDRTVTP